MTDLFDERVKPVHLDDEEVLRRLTVIEHAAPYAHQQSDIEAFEAEVERRGLVREVES